MSKIISRLNAINPEAKIFVLTAPKTGSVDPYNEAVVSIVNKMKASLPVHCIDLRNYKKLYDIASITADANDNHYTASGYEQFAEILRLAMSEYICSHISEFKDVAFIPYDDNGNKTAVLNTEVTGYGSVEIADAANGGLSKLNVYATHTVNLSPTQDAPVSLPVVNTENASVSVGDYVVPLPSAALGCVRYATTDIRNATNDDGTTVLADYIDFEAGEIVKMVGEMVFTGQEAWEATNTSCVYRLDISARFIVPNGEYCVMSTHYKPGRMYNTISDLAIAPYNSRACVVRDDRFQTLEDFKTFLAGSYDSGNPVTIRTRLKKPERIKLSDDEMIAYAKVRTNASPVTITNTLGTTFTVGYVADAKAYIDRMLSAIPATVPLME